MVFNRNWWWCEEQLRLLLVLLHFSYYLAAELSKGMEDQNNLVTVLSINQIYESRRGSMGKKKKNSQIRRPKSIFNSLSHCLLLLCAAQGPVTCSSQYVFLLCTHKTELPLKVQLIFSNNLLGTASNFYLMWHHMVYTLIG